MKMFDPFHAHRLKDIRRVVRLQAKLYRNGVDETAIAAEQGLPRRGVPRETHRNQFRVIIRGSAHYQGFLDFQKLSSAKNSMTMEERSTIRNRPVPRDRKSTRLNSS